MDSTNLLNSLGDFFKNFNLSRISPTDIIFLLVCLIIVWFVFKILGAIARMISVAVFIFVIFIILQKSQSGAFANLDILGIVQKDIQIILSYAKNLIGI